MHRVGDAPAGKGVGCEQVRLFVVVDRTRHAVSPRDGGGAREREQADQQWAEESAQARSYPAAAAS
jgi:hypothetical protein